MVLAGAAIGLLKAPASATLVNVTYYDQGVVNPEFAGGPLWTGRVDTVANTVTILTWTELPLHGSEFWIPQNLPLVWPARNAAGGLYDVPDSFDGHIDETWAFVSDQTLSQMGWRQPTFNYATNPPVLVSLTPATFSNPVLGIRPGWGGYAYGPAGSDPATYRVDVRNPDHTTAPDNSELQPLFDERIMPALPVGPSTYTWSTEATVSIVQSAPVSVPESPAWQLWSAISAGGAIVAMARHAIGRMRQI
jgi:hypothetical protein